MPTRSSEVVLVHLTHSHRSPFSTRIKSLSRLAGRCALRAFRVVALSSTALLLFFNVLPVSAQNPDGGAASQRLKAERPNEYRGGKGVASMQAAQQNMKDLFEKILISGQGDGKADQWYSPHLRDISGTPDNRNLEAGIRGTTAPRANMIDYCMDPENLPIPAACPLTEISWLTGTPVCYWHEDEQPAGYGPQSHRPFASCFTEQSTQIYSSFTQPSNFKMCCVREGEEENASSEYIASKHPSGDGWAGLFEYYYPTEALGWENERTTTMIVDQAKVQQCVAASDSLMESSQAQQWVVGAINRNLKAVGGQPGGNIQQTVQDALKSVRPKDQKLRFADSLQSEGLTLRVNLAAMDPQQRRNTAERFCMRPEQFDKLMDPTYDKLQLGGGSSLGSLDAIPVWSNYCREGVELMTNPNNSTKLRNLDGTPTKFDMGMAAWQADPMFCQKMNLTNVNMLITGLGRAPLLSGGAFQTQAAVGYTCLEGGKLNGSMVPVELYRHAAVERRTAITDHALGFLIAGGLAPGMIGGTTSYYKRFEPQPYSMDMPFHLQTFIGTRFSGGGTNEKGATCPSLSGENYQHAGSKSDRLFISDKTNQAFDQDIVQANGQKGDFNRYREEWGKDQQSAAKIAARGLDKHSQNYAAPFRIFATCPAGYKRWRPKPADSHNLALIENVNRYCREENFGGLSAAP